MYNRQYLEGGVCDFAIRRKTYIEYIHFGRQVSIFSLDDPVYNCLSVYVESTSVLFCVSIALVILMLYSVL